MLIILGQQYSSNFIDEPDSCIMFGQAPNGDPYLPNLNQCNDEGKTWSLVCYPGNNPDNDEYISGSGPVPDHYNNTPINPSSQDNPLSDWVYLHDPVAGDMLTYIPYQELKLYLKKVALVKRIYLPIGLVMMKLRNFQFMEMMLM